MWLFEVTGSLGRVFVDAPPVEVSRLRNDMVGGFVFIGVSLVVQYKAGATENSNHSSQ